MSVQMLLQSKLAKRVTFWVFLAILLVEIAILIPSYFGERVRFLEKIGNEGLAIAKTVVRAIPDGAARTDIEALGLRLIAGQRVVGAVLLDGTGREVAAFGERPRLAAGSPQTHWLNPEETRYDMVYPAAALMDEITVVARLTTEGGDAHVQGYVWRIIGLIVIVVLSISAASLAVVFYLVLWPLSAIRRGLDGASPLPSGRDDEFGAVARALEEGRRRQGEVERLQRRQQEAERKAEAERRTGLEQLAGEVERGIQGALDELSREAETLHATADTMAKAARQTSALSGEVCRASEKASGNVETVAAAAEELSASIGEISRRVADSSRIARQASEEAQRTDSTVRGLQEAADRIGTVVQLISDIAAQTNLLALNATIEAARAGEAGKGFAVVAGEVKSLANQTAKATDDIARQIQDIQQVAGRAAEAIGGIAGTVAEIDSIATGIAAAVEEQGAATNEIARNVAEAASSTRGVLDHVGQVTRAADESGTAAGRVLTASDTLRLSAERMRAEVGRLTRQIRAG